MKRSVISFFVLLSIGNVFGQSTRSEFEEEIANKKTGDDKANFSSILNAFGNFTSQDEGTISFQPTLYGLASMFNPALKSQDNFVRNAFIRNFQLDLGVTPSGKSIFRLDDFQSGFSYAILNNKKLSSSDYKNLVASGPAQQRKLFDSVLGRFIFDNRNTAEGEKAKSYANRALSVTDISKMSADLKAFLKSKLNLSTDQELVEMSSGFTAAYKSLTTELSKRTLLTVDFKSTYSFLNSEWDELSFTPMNLYFYFNKKKLSSPGLNATLNYVIGADTSAKEALKRRTIETEVGMNFPIKVDPDTEKAMVEVKPGISYKYIAQRLYKDENRSKFDPTLTFRIRINDDFYLPLKLEYDTENAELFGFLSIQVSLN